MTAKVDKLTRCFCAVAKLLVGLLSLLTLSVIGPILSTRIAKKQGPCKYKYKYLWEKVFKIQVQNTTYNHIFKIVF